MHKALSLVLNTKYTGGVVIHTSKSSTWEIEAELGDQGHPLLPDEFETSLRYLSPQKKDKGREQKGKEQKNQPVHETVGARAPRQRRALHEEVLLHWGTLGQMFPIAPNTVAQ